MAVDMSTWVATKAQTNPDAFLGASMQSMDMANKRGKERPFNYQTAVAMYRGWTYAAVWMNAKAVQSTPLKLYVRKGKGEKLVNSRSLAHVASRQRKFMLGRLKHKPSEYVLSKAVEWGGEFEEVVEAHPVTQLLARPNPYMLGGEFALMRMMMLSLTGNFYTHPVVESLRFEGKSLSRVKELWVMPSQYVKIQPGEANEEDYIRGYWYGIDPTKSHLFEADEVWHSKRPNPGSQWYGLGEIEAGWSTHKIDMAQRETDQAKYDNQARPDLVVITKSANVTFERLQEMQQEWAQRFRGTFRQGSPVFLTGDTQVIPLNWVPKEIGDAEIIIEEIAAIHGVPVTLLKANDPNLASAQVGFASWRELTTLPMCQADEEFLNAKIMPAFGIEEDAFLAYDDPVPENRDELRQDGDVAIKNGNITRNEWRVENGYDPVEEENADTLLVPTGYQPIDKVGEAPPGFGGLTFGGQGDGKEEMGKPNPPKGGPEDDSDKDSEKHLSQRAEIYDHHGHGIVGKGDADDTARDGESERKIRAFKLALDRVFAEQEKACRSVLSGQKSVKDAGTIANLIAAIMNTSPDLALAIEPFIHEILASGGRRGLAEIHVAPEAFDVVNPRVADFMRRYTIRLAGEVNKYTAQVVAESLADGFEQGETTRELQQRVSGVYSDFSGYRTEMIARTESARAFVSGEQEAWAQSDVVEGKTWELAVGGCAACNAAHRDFGAKAIPIEQPFYPLGSTIATEDGPFRVDYTAIMGPPLHPHCRCGVTPVLKKVEP